ncbi:hypothetical protein C2S53_019932 [Perilla frutescens var. hirtella]|uniref:Uncharacterized protein n=1 Tax=Perilla frutescens var. hirtella TaxID=608512 RepID=A0AAD4P7H7_PERFH|nr:hypothetical protein C2S53_019932 [Perilla frutescens var. hirtella]
MSGDAAALTFLLQLVTDVLKDYKDLKAGAGYEFGQLKNELLLLKAFLEDSTRKSEKNEVFRAKEREISELVYDVEDIIETHLAKTAIAKKKNIVSRILNKFSTDMAQQVKILREKRVRPIIDVIEKDFGKIEVGDGSSTGLGNRRAELKKDQSMRQPSVTFIHDQSTGQQFLDTTQDQSIAQPSTSQDQSSKQDNVVDFEDEATIKRYLMDPKDELDVISISGMAGLGKTTLAWKIFQDREISLKFPLRIWIHVSQKFKSRDVFIDILERFTSQDTSRLRDDELIRTVLRRAKSWLPVGCEMLLHKLMLTGCYSI